MQFTEEQAAEVKNWVVKKLEDISDADSDVLADYVLALIRSDAPDEEIRRASIENLEDFLKENTTKFVDEIFEKYNPKPRQQPAQTIPQPAAPVPPQSLPFNQPIPSAPVQPFGNAHPAQSPLNRGSYEPEGSNISRKRSYHDGPQGREDQDSHYNRADRPFKSARRPSGRGDRGGRGGWGFNQPGRPGPPPNQLNAFQGMPPVPPPGFPPFDPNDPMGAMLALQAMGFPQMPGMPPMPQMPPQMGSPGQTQDRNAGSPPAIISQRCKDYDTKGFCVLGSTCPYRHGPDHVVASKDDEYDPTKSNIVMDKPLGANGQPSRGGDRGRGRGRGRGDRGAFGPQRGGRSRAEFSQAGPNDDQSITTIVVEQIPEDKFEEGTVRDFFSEFGNILDITMKPYKHLALVKYDTYAAARRAWSSPKVIFDNRFVKVYWYKPTPKDETNGGPSPAKNGTEEKPFDQEAFEKQQAEAQQSYEEKMKRRKATEDARLALEKQRDELLKKQQEEKDRLLQRLGTTQTTNGDGQDKKAETKESDQKDDNVSEQTKALRAQLAALEDEAKSLGLDPNSSQFPGRGRGRGGFGGYQGRGGYVPRGRGYDPYFRGGYRGRGAPRGRGGGGVMRLDNRPKRVAVSGVEFNPAQDEALRQFLVGIGEYESIEPNPEHADSLIVSFKDRYVAEKLMYGSSDIPSLGKVQFSWVAGPSTTSSSVPQTPQSSAPAPGGKDEDEMMTGQNEADALAGRKDAGHEVDYDVAEVDDSWAIE